MLVLHGAAVHGHPEGVGVQIDGDRIRAIGPHEAMTGRRIDAAGATLVPGRIDLALDLDLPEDPAAAVLAAIETLRRLRRDGLAGARVHGPALIASLVAAQESLLLPRLRPAGFTLRFGGGMVRVLGRPTGRSELAADDQMVTLLLKAPMLEAIEGDPPHGIDTGNVPVLRDVIDKARFCGFDDVGHIAPGYRADLAAVEPDGRTRFRLVAGMVLSGTRPGNHADRVR